MKIFSVLCCFVLLSTTAISQTRTKQLVYQGGGSMADLLAGAYYVYEEEDAFNITHYLYPDWHPGSIELIDGTIITDTYVNYNILKGTLEEFVDGKLSAYSAYQVKSFKIIDYDMKQFVNYLAVSTITDEQEMMTGFVRLIEGGNAKLVERAYFQMKNQPSAGYALFFGNDEADIRKTKQYYLYENNFLKPVRKAGTFGEQAHSIKAHAKKHALQWNREADLAQLVSYYNWLKDSEQLKPTVPVVSVK